MSDPHLREVEHSIDVAAPAASVYELVAGVEHWPRIFPPTIHVDVVERSDDAETIRIWATANGEAKNWTSRRTLDPAALRIGFRQERSAPPVAAMGGAWVFEPLDESTSRIRLLHDYRAIEDDPDSLAWIDRAVDENSRSELSALRTTVEAAVAAKELTFSFEDSVHVDGTAGDLYDFVNDAHLWQERLPHVATVEMSEPSPGLQILEMQTRAKDGSTHLTKSYRVCDGGRIAYKQVTLPALLNLHTGRWTFEPSSEGGVRATSQHTVVLNPDTIGSVLGPEKSVEDARTFVQGALSANSLATLGHAKSYAEQRR